MNAKRTLKSVYRMGILVLFPLLFTCAGAFGQGSSENKTGTTTTDMDASAEMARIAQIREHWKQRRPQYTGERFAVAPLLTAPYAPGTLNARFVQDGLNMVNFVRSLAGIKKRTPLKSASLLSFKDSLFYPPHPTPCDGEGA